MQARQSKDVRADHVLPRLDVTKRDVEKVRPLRSTGGRRWLLTLRGQMQNFEGYGTIVDCRIMGGFGFLEFDSPRVGPEQPSFRLSQRLRKRADAGPAARQDADEVCRNFNNKPFLGGPESVAGFTQRPLSPR